MSVFGSASIVEKELSTALTERGIPLSDVEWESKLLSFSQIFGQNTKFAIASSLDPGGTPYAPVGSGDPVVLLYPNASSPTKIAIKSGTARFLVWANDGSGFITRDELSNFIEPGNLGQALFDDGVLFWDFSEDPDPVDAGSVANPSSASTFFLRAYGTTRYDDPDRIETVTSVWMYLSFFGASGTWIKLYPQASGGAASPEDARVFQTQFSPNGIFASTHRGETLVTSSSISNDVVSNADLKIWYAYNGNANNNWVQLN